jgi:protein O-GlcNAc transferase
MEPMMAPGDKAMFYRYLDRARTYFEYGSGGSTYQASKRAQKVYSVESCPEWHAKLKGMLSPDKINFIYGDMNTLPNTFGDPGPGCTLAQKQAYSGQIQLLSPEARAAIDLVLIDGRFRVACCLKCFDAIRDDCLIAFDDFLDRPQYHTVLAYYEVVEKTSDNRMAILKKRGVTVDPALIAKYETDRD